MSPQAEARLQEAASFHHAGRLDDAEAIYRSVIASEPDNVDALHLLGLLCHQTGRDDEAIALIAAALARAPDFAGAHANLGNVFRAEGRLDEAIAQYRKALHLAPNSAATLNNLGAVLRATGDAEGAVACYHAALEADPREPGALTNLGTLLRELGRLDAWVAACQAVIDRAPDAEAPRRQLASALGELGWATHRAGKKAAAIDHYRQALALDPTLAATQNNLAAALLAEGRLADAITHFREAVALDPDFPEFHFNLGNALRQAGTLDAAIACYRRTLALTPNHVDAATNLGTALKDQGALDEALESYRAALAAMPEGSSSAAGAQGNLLMSLAYDPTQSAAQLRMAADVYGRLLDRRVRHLAPPQRVRDPARRLRLGYVSADFRQHPVGWFMQAPLAHHDRRRFELFCYANQTEIDNLTGRLHAHADHWRDVSKLSDDTFAGLLEGDQIDILIDLAGHSAGNRLPVFARRLAPIQASWIGYPMTTGIRAMDYLIADGRLVPPGCEAEFSETVVRLREVAWCYTAPDFAPPVAPLPARRNGHVTLGCFNNPIKLSPALLGSWAAILDRLPGARLMLKYHQLEGGAAAARLRAAARAAGIAPERLILQGASPHDQALAAYGEIDLALDSFPFGGGATTCEALWMGVPVVTCAGATMAGRMGASFLTAIGLPELIAPDQAGYVETAVAAAHDLERLAELRAELRARMIASPLCDGARFMTGFEAALRDLWRDYCTREPR